LSVGQHSGTIQFSSGSARSLAVNAIRVPFSVNINDLLVYGIGAFHFDAFMQQSSRFWEWFVDVIYLANLTHKRSEFSRCFCSFEAEFSQVRVFQNACILQACRLAVGKKTFNRTFVSCSVKVGDNLGTNGAFHSQHIPPSGQCHCILEQDRSPYWRNGRFLAYRYVIADVPRRLRADEGLIFGVPGG
jgi:hypothetical protein